MFDGAAAGIAPTFIDAWAGTFCYAFQIYFDFSGYCDMAVGLARMFGIRLPMNFASPYKATSIIDFWRRWHITLSRFLRDYLYIPLGGNRQGPIRRYVNVFVTMVLGGLWHGAGWTFVLWGALHGIMIMVNQAWRQWRRSRPAAALLSESASTAAPRLFSRMRPFSRALTFLLVAVAWVPFRAVDFAACVRVYEGMVGLNGISLPAVAQAAWVTLPGQSWLAGVEFRGTRVDPFTIVFWMPILLGAVWFLPNSMEYMRMTRPILATPNYPATYLSRARPRIPVWRRQPAVALLVGAAAALSLIKFNDTSQFLYFQF